MSIFGRTVAIALSQVPASSSILLVTFGRAWLRAVVFVTFAHVQSSAPKPIKPTAFLSLHTLVIPAAAPTLITLRSCAKWRREVIIELVVLIDPSPGNDGDPPLFHIDPATSLAGWRLLGEDAVLPKQVDITAKRVR
eukprot:CAMPEP_0183375906 /NCGR_PEP_ID=MMETSP0164_2-20130417/118712_1 /TAXON_ID=221442 /ORGANISM="Coccolithus pelagicus ssp braarudi, Strain PLY182g" /LENGTH=136 /DNA_ID=CAMNT_0025553125 /DNA_START=68 /DNA_END=478 /DNA_ORIENTATION=-